MLHSCSKTSSYLRKQQGVLEGGGPLPPRRPCTSAQKGQTPHRCYVIRSSIQVFNAAFKNTITFVLKSEGKDLAALLLFSIPADQNTTRRRL